MLNLDPNLDLGLVLDILLNKTVIIGYLVFLAVLFIIRVITFVPGEERATQPIVPPTTVVVNDGKNDEDVEDEDEDDGPDNGPEDDDEDMV